MAGVDVGIHVNQLTPDSGYSHFFSIAKDSVTKGFKVALKDTSYRVKWMLITYSKRDFVKEYSVNGWVVDASSVPVFDKLEVGDMFAIDCINVGKNGQTFLTTSMVVYVYP